MNLAPFIQSTLIRSGISEREIVAHCQECLEYGFDAAMVPACWVAQSVAVLRNTRVKVASAVDFPWGIMTTVGKAAEAHAAVSAGAQEIDTMLNLGWFKSGRYDAVREDLATVVRAAHPAPVKVMLELPLLTADERELAVKLALAAGVQWLKNASAGSVGVATPEDMRFLRERAPAGVHVKASGGIKTAAHVRALLAAGAERVGTSAGVAIIKGEAGDSY